MTINNEDKKLNFLSEREQSQACLNSAEHEKNQGRKVLNVPNLRFKEFQGEWEKCTLGNNVKIQGGYAFKSELFLRKGIPIIRISNLPQNASFVDLDDCTYYKEGNYNSFEVHNGDLLIAMSGATTGKTAIYNRKTLAYLNQRVGLFKSTNRDSLYYPFLYALVSTPVFKRQLSTRLIAGAQPNISSSDIESIRISIPQKNEQEKIAHLMLLLNERITTQNKNIEDLKKLKVAIIEKMFCSPNQEQPMCRIKGFKQPLTTYKLGSFCSRIVTKNKDAKCSLVLTIAAQYGLVNQETFFNKSVASENLTGYYLLHKGEFAYNRSYSAGYDWGTVKRLDNYDEGVLSTLYICFKINETIVDSDYLAYYFESTKWHRGLSDIAGEGARNHGLLNVSMADYFNTKHRFPVIEEQKAIAKILNAITEKERKATLLGECYQKQKQYLLRQMFI